MDEALSAVRDYISKIAEKSGLALNPDGRRLEKLAHQLRQTFIESGGYFCPCKRSYPLNPATDTPCPCESFAEDSRKFGHCDCKLFFDIGACTAEKLRPGLLATVACPG